MSEENLVVTVEKGRNGAPDKMRYDVFLGNSELINTLLPRYTDDLRDTLGREVNPGQALVMAGWNPEDHPESTKAHWFDLTLEEMLVLLEKHLDIHVTYESTVHIHGDAEVEEALITFGASSLEEAAENWFDVTEKILDLVPGSRIGAVDQFTKVTKALDVLQQEQNTPSAPTSEVLRERQPLLLPLAGEKPTARGKLS